MYICGKQSIQILIILLLTLLVTTANAEEYTQRFSCTQFGTEEGLSSQRVFSITTDKSGAIWIATLDGINRYNGHSMKSYNLGENHNSSDASGSTIMLTTGPENSLYAYNNVGRIYKYNALTDQFELCLDLAEHIHAGLALECLFIDSQECLWIGLSTGLYYSQPNEAPKLIASDCSVTHITELPQGVAVGTTDNLRIYSKERKLLHQFCSGTHIQSLLIPSDSNSLLVGTFNGIIKSINLKTWQEHSPILSPLPHTPIRSMIEVSPSTILLGYDGDGVYIYNHSTGKVAPLFTRANRMLTAMGVYSLCRDHEDNIWVGTYAGGTFLMMPEENTTTLLRHREGSEPSLADDNVNALCEQSNGELWIATDNGISIYNPTTNRFRQALAGNVVLSISASSDDLIAAGTYGNGVFLLNSQGQVQQHYIKTNSDLPSNYLSAVLFDSDCDLWVGTMDNQLMQLNHHTRQWKSYDTMKVRCIVQKNTHTIAIGTVDGLVLINKQTGKQVHLLKGTANRGQDFNAFIQSITFVNDNQAWLGTDGGGLYLYDLQTTEKKILSTDDRLPSNRVCALLIDHDNMLWITTDHGLACLPSHPSMQIYNQNFEHTMSRTYNRSAAIRLSDGRVALGSTTGVLIFKPHISLTSYPTPPLQFTDFRIDNIDISEAMNMRPKLMQMLADSTVVLSYRHNSFTVGFESISFRYQSNIVYEYMLEGFDRGWNSPGRNEQLRYTNVSPGKYRLYVQSRSLNNGIILSSRSVDIIICQPWWNTWWAWLLYIITLCSIVAIIIRSKQQQLMRRYMNEKITFFISVAHDIRTPLTLVKAPLDELHHDSTLHDRAAQAVQLARSNLDKLLNMLSQLLDFERMEHPNMKPRIEAVSLSQIVGELVIAFQPLCQQKNLTLKTNEIDNNLYVWADTNLLNRILTNLLSNAIKYTSAEGNVGIRVKAEGDKIKITVADTGIGISSKEQKKLFTSFFRASNAINSGASGIGLGLLQAKRFASLLKGDIKFTSTEGKGSEFTLILNKVTTAISTHNHYSETTETAENVASGDSDKDLLLIVEDNDELRRYMRQLFEPLYRVIDKSNAAEALECMETQYPSLVLTDVMMPGMQGDEMCHRIKSNPTTSGIPVILLTAKTFQKAIIEGLQKGADDYIAKPFDIDVLKAKVQAQIDNRKRLRQHYTQIALQHTLADSANKSASGKTVEKTTVQDIASIPNDADSEFVEKATRIVKENMSNLEFDIDRLCRDMAMCRTLFHERLKALTGHTPQDFIRMIRLEHAAALLLQGIPVTDVSIHAGFANAKYFSTLFKKYFGVQPSRYIGKNEETS
ncbi:hybrid sensor histidine kinase/response regulator transcription factor [uncultured Bacteroides sp.]|uniref:hybrid sensor histidine kinase/response regulator transcription factor n=1 Tax=uncultured Bacteroides sp. TaxID=162156 RepID=UPI0025D0709E|nr:hybrid sensor histidine kinase/response regulator transcription factor [uncultured Bacteroides sp.]